MTSTKVNRLRSKAYGHYLRNHAEFVRKYLGKTILIDTKTFEVLFVGKHGLEAYCYAKEHGLRDKILLQDVSARIYQRKDKKRKVCCGR